jgi:prepilin-type N-terminal cleavage/methylation domain-containing protein
MARTAHTSLLARWRERLAAERGFTIFEVLVAAVLFAIVLGALLEPLEVSQRTQVRDINYAYAQQEERTGLDSMVSQIRQAYAVLSTTSNAIEINVNLNGVAEHVYYECDIPQSGTSYQECVRTQAAAGAALPPTTSGTVVLRNLTNGTAVDPVFTFSPDPINPYYLTATIKVPASGATNGGLTHSIVFSDGVLMRNQNIGD